MGKALPLLILVALGLLIMAGAGCDRGSSRDSAATRPSSADAAVKPVVAVPPAPKPTGPLPKGASCITAECHATYASAAHIHGPVSERACDVCHDADTGQHAFPLKRDNVQTCTFCHSSVAGTRSHQHGALQQGCTACHDPHAAPVKFLLKADNVERLCAKCHQIPLKKHAHGPFAAGECTVCHQPHQSQFASLLRGGEGPDHCYSCHGDMKKSVASAARLHKPAGEKCTACHSPHSTDYPRELKAPVDQTCYGCHQPVRQHVQQAAYPHAAVTAGDSCANCHNPHASDRPGLLPARMDQVCLKCHQVPQPTPDGRIIASMKEPLSAKYLHGPIRSGDCSACHDAHGAANTDLLKKPFPRFFYAAFDVNNYALCFSCHDQQLVLADKTRNLTNFRDGDRNLHFVHVNRDQKGRSCKSCHAIHGSDIPRHMASEVPFEGSKWAMPIKYEPAATGGSCSPGCHQPQKYDRDRSAPPPATAPTTRGGT